MRITLVRAGSGVLAVTLAGAMAYGRPSARPSWLGHHEVTLCAKGSYAYVYSTHRYQPTLSVDITRVQNGGFDLRFQNRGYECTLRAKEQNGELTVDPNQICRLAIATPDFCLLREAECDAGGRRDSCDDEKRLGHFGALRATVTEATLRRVGQQLQLDFEASVDGCVLAIGYLGNVPVPVHGGRLESTSCQ